MVAEASISLDILEGLLQNPPVQHRAEASLEMRRLRTAALIYDVWTEKGKDVSGLAAR